MKQTRNRRKAPELHPIGMATLEQWQTSIPDRTWASTDPQFRKVYTVLTNERVRAFDLAPLPVGCILTEQARYGIQMGFEAAIKVLERMATAPEPPPPEREVPDFPEQGRDLHEPATTE